MEKDKELHEYLEKLEKDSKKQLFHSRLQTLLSLVAALCIATVAYVSVNALPALLKLAGEAEALIQEAEVVMDNMKEVTDDLAKVEFADMVQNVDSLVTSSEEGLKETLEKISSIDIEKLNQAIDDLAQIVEPLARLVNPFGR